MLLVIIITPTFKVSERNVFMKSSDCSRHFPLTVHSVLATLKSNPKCERFHSLWNHASVKSFATGGHLSFSSLIKFNLPVESSVKDDVHDYFLDLFI